MAAISLTPITGNDCVLTITNGVVTTILRFANGDLKLPGLNAGMKNAKRTSMQEVTDFFVRGKWVGAKYTKGKILEGSFTGLLTEILGVAADVADIDPVLMQGDWAGAASTTPASRGDVPHVTLTWAIERSDFGASADRSVALKYCELLTDLSEADEGSTYTINFRLKPYSTDSFVIT